MDGYPTAFVCRLTGINRKTLHYWDKTGFLSPTVEMAHGAGSRKLYGFCDLVSIQVALELRDHGISLQGLRRVMEYLQKSKHLEHALTETFLITDGLDVYERRGEEILSVLRNPGQGKFAFVVLDLGLTVANLRHRIEEQRSA